MLFKKKKKVHEETRKIVLTEDASLRIIEAYNRLKDNILYMSADGKNRVIQVESAKAGEGKSTIAANLAVGLGQTDRTVCVVDLDFRKPKVHTFFKLSKDIGISEFMRGVAKKEDIIKATEYKNVSIVTGGETIHNSSFVLLSDVFKAFIEELKTKFDYVILDCPPVLQVSDYIHISKVSEGVLFVVAFGQTTRQQVAEAIKELKRNNVNILGTVFSKYNTKGKDYYYNQYYYYTRRDDEE